MQPGVAATPPGLPGCERLLVSPAFASDGTAFCVGIDYRAAAIRLYVSTDHAKAWRRTEPTGLPSTAAGTIDAAISPVFPSDGLLVVQFDSTVYYSVDRGASFRVAPVTGPVSIATTGRSVTPIPGLPAEAVPALETHGVIIGPGLPVSAVGPGSMMFDPTLATVRTIAGTGSIDRKFAVSPRHQHDGIAFAVGKIGGAGPFDTAEQLFTCDAVFSCTAQRARFPVGETVDRVWFPADHDRSGVLFVTTLVVGTDRPKVYVSRDRGATFASSPVLQRASDELHRLGIRPAVALTGGTLGSRTMFARVSGGNQAPNPPSERLYRSDDTGTTWRLVAYGRLPGTPGARGTMPYGYAYGSSASRPTPLGLLTFAGGRLLMTGARWSPLGYVVWCSANGGTRWAAACR